MCRFLRNLCVGLMGVMLFPLPSFAGWIAITNDTANTVVVQESITSNGQTRKCKPIKLAPGEILREFQQAGGTKKLTVSETGLLGKQLFSGDLTWKEDAAFSIHKDGDKVKISDAKTLTAKAGEGTASKPAEKKAPDEKKPR